MRIVGDTASWGTSSDVTTVQFEVTSRVQSVSELVDLTGGG